jgi:DNA polymerase III delta prime subunit
MLTQERLGELIGVELGHSGYRGAAVSDWERDKSKIDEDNRHVLVALVTVLHQCGGLRRSVEADKLLTTGNYRRLDGSEQKVVFPDHDQAIKPEESETSGDQTADPFLLPPSWPPLVHKEKISKDRRRQLHLLEKVRRFWVQGVLEKSIHDATLIEIACIRHDQAIKRPWDDVLHPAVYQETKKDECRNIGEIYESADRALLILGEPGSGKTTTLITLAGELIARAEMNSLEPIPVIFSLASWVERRAALADWIVEELITKYQVPAKRARRWLMDERLLPLLDSFDEVPDRYRNDCILAINHFRVNQGSSGLVICSRTREYEAASARFVLGKAILLQPLSQDQIVTYLEAAGPQLANLRQAIAQNDALREIARSPLMLSVIAFSYRDAGPIDIEDRELSEDDLRQRLFGSYVRHMFQRRSQHQDYSQAQTKRWLGWLARQLSFHNQTIFHIEQLQPSWLPSRRLRWLYMFISGLFTGLFGGVVILLLMQLLRHTTPFFPESTSANLETALPVTLEWAEILVIFTGNVILALLTTFIMIIYFEHRRRVGTETILDVRQRQQQVAVVGLVTGLLSLAVVAWFEIVLWAIVWGLAEAVLFMTIARGIYGWSYRYEIRTVEGLTWSWSGAVRLALLGLFLTVLSELIERSLGGGSTVFRTLLTFVLATLLLGGLQRRRLNTLNYPYQGIWLTVRSAITAGSMVGLLLGAVNWYLRDAITGLLTGLLVALLFVSLFGGGNVVQHFLVRFLLWRNNCIPRGYARFLDHATSLIFVRKVGGGYIFVHSLLQGYFAGQR